MLQLLLPAVADSDDEAKATAVLTAKSEVTPRRPEEGRVSDLSLIALACHRLWALQIKGAVIAYKLLFVEPYAGAMRSTLCPHRSSQVLRGLASGGSCLCPSPVLSEGYPGSQRSLQKSLEVPD